MPFQYVSDLVHPEFEAFFGAHPNDAADSYALLNQVAVAGMAGIPPGKRDGFGMAKPYCHQVNGWGIFFAVEGPWRGPCTVTLLLITEFTKTPIELAKREAVQRWRSAANRS